MLLRADQVRSERRTRLKFSARTATAAGAAVRLLDYTANSKVPSVRRKAERQTNRLAHAYRKSYRWPCKEPRPGKDGVKASRKVKLRNNKVSKTIAAAARVSGWSLQADAVFQQ